MVLGAWNFLYCPLFCLYFIFPPFQSLISFYAFPFLLLCISHLLSFPHITSVSRILTFLLFYFNAISFLLNFVLRVFRISFSGTRFHCSATPAVVPTVSGCAVAAMEPTSFHVRLLSVRSGVERQRERLHPHSHRGWQTPGDSQSSQVGKQLSVVTENVSSALALSVFLHIVRLYPLKSMNTVTFIGSWRPMKLT